MLTTLDITQRAKFPFYSKGSDGAARPCGYSVKTSDYSVAYAAVDGSGWIHIVPKTIGTVTVTISGHSQDGTAMTPLSLDFSVTPVPVPQADHFEIGTIEVMGPLAPQSPADPGTDTVTGTL